MAKLSLTPLKNTHRQWLEFLKQIDGIIGPALGGLLIPLNAAAFVLMLIAVGTWRRTKVAVDTPLEGIF